MGVARQRLPSLQMGRLALGSAAMVAKLPPARRRDLNSRYEVSPVHDHCNSNTMYVQCPHWPGAAPGRCFIGAMGWLQACRAAYVEGMDVLYGTCNFHI